MSFIDNSSLRWFQFEIFQDEPELVQGVFTRQGGVSPAPWSSLNMATSVGDHRSNVIENRARIQSALQIPQTGFFDVWQVHSNQVIQTDHPRLPDQPHVKADSIISNNKSVAILMLFADCVPIFLYDPIRQVIGMAHAGWKGTVHKVVSETVQAMQDAYQTRPADIIAGIGPSICSRHYQVGQDVIESVDEAFGRGSGFLIDQKDGKAQLDLWQANHQILTDSGVLPAHIEIAGICTVEHPQDWFSHRGEQGKTGRFAAVMAFGPQAG
jgi:YfiH family protein